LKGIVCRERYANMQCLKHSLIKIVRRKMFVPSSLILIHDVVIFYGKKICTLHLWDSLRDYQVSNKLLLLIRSKRKAIKKKGTDGSADSD
jgi:hypothetical protein